MKENYLQCQCKHLQHAKFPL